MDINSHIQIPKCVLKQFENENHELFYFDKNKYNKMAPINKGRAKSLNTQIGYYSDDTEDALNRNIETPLGRLLKLINESDFNAENVDLPTNSEAIIRNYAYSLLCRSQQLLKALSKKSVYFQFFSNERDKHDIAVINGMNSAIKTDYFGGWHLALILNKTKAPFVLPLYGVFSFNDKNNQSLQIPLTPKISAMLIDGNQFKELFSKNTTPTISLFDEQQIFTINQIGCRYELTNNRGICISNNKEYLNDVISSLLEI